MKKSFKELYTEAAKFKNDAGSIWKIRYKKTGEFVRFSVESNPYKKAKNINLGRMVVGDQEVSKDTNVSYHARTTLWYLGPTGDVFKQPNRAIEKLKQMTGGPDAEIPAGNPKDVNVKNTDFELVGFRMEEYRVEPAKKLI